MVFEGEPSQSFLVFTGSKDIAIIIRQAPISKGGKKMSQYYLGLPETMVWRYKITPDICIKTQPDKEHILYSGKNPCYVTEYPSHLIDTINTHPEDPVIIAHCNFDGTESSDVDVVVLKNAHLEAVIAELKAENDSLWERFRELQDKFEVQQQRMMEKAG